MAFLIAREFRFFRKPATFVLGAGDSAGLVTEHLITDHGQYRPQRRRMRLNEKQASRSGERRGCGIIRVLGKWDIVPYSTNNHIVNGLSLCLHHAPSPFDGGKGRDGGETIPQSRSPTQSCRAETRRIFWLVNVLFRPGSELQIPLNPPLLKGEMKPAGIFLLFD